MNLELYLEEFPSPIGGIYLVSSPNGVCALDFQGYDDRMNSLLTRQFGTYTIHSNGRVSESRRRVEAYFSGEVRAVDSIQVDVHGTGFQREVWAALRTIAAGATQSYRQLAQRIGRPKATRAVGLANSQNPVAIIQPCHRVIGTNSKLTGYAGGLDRKAWLLRHEGALLL